MESFYDWSQRAMVEHYLDACVPIFPEAGPGDPGFECSFTNVNETSFLVTYNSTCVRARGWAGGRCWRAGARAVTVADEKLTAFPSLTCPP